jgi:hypothetical protein
MAQPLIATAIPMANKVNLLNFLMSMVEKTLLAKFAKTR